MDDSRRVGRAQARAKIFLQFVMEPARACIFSVLAGPKSLPAGSSIGAK